MASTFTHKLLSFLVSHSFTVQHQTEARYTKILPYCIRLER